MSDAMDEAGVGAPLRPDGHGTEADRVRLGSSPSTPAYVLAGLACDPAVTVRATVAMNPACPPHIDHAVAQDADERVRVLLARKLAPSLSGAEQADAYGQLRETLALLAADAALRVRAAVADCVKSMPDAPRDLILQLAGDAALPVCDPVVRLSPLLTDEDLLDLLAAHPNPAVAASVASRPCLSADLADAVAAGADDAAVRALLLNNSAAIRDETLETLAEDAAAHLDWHEPLVRRPRLTPRAAAALSGFVASQLLDALAQRPDLDPAVTAELRDRMAARLRAPPEPEPDGNGEDGDKEDGDEEDDGMLMDALRDLDAAGRLNEAVLIAAARAGDLRRVAAVLAVAAGLPLAAVFRAAALRNARALIALAWRAGFSVRVAMVAQASLGRLGPTRLIPAGPGGAFPLTPDEMRRQLEALAESAR